jgi:hypothetical protein
MNPAWPDPPWLTRTLLESPWQLAIVIVVVGAAALVAGVNQGRPTLQRAGLGSLLCAVLLVGVAWAVETDRELLMRLTRSLVAAAAADPMDLDTFSRLSDPQANVGGDDRDTLMELARSVSQKVRVDQALVMDLNALVTTEDRSKSLLAVAGKATLRRGDFQSPYSARMILQWRKSDGQWRVVGLERLAVNGRDVQASLRGLL